MLIPLLNAFGFSFFPLIFCTRCTMYYEDACIYFCPKCGTLWCGCLPENSNREQILERKTTIQRAVQIGMKANAIAIVPFIHFSSDPFHHIHKQSVKSFGECVSKHSSVVFDGICTFNLHMQFLFSCNKEFHSNVWYTIRLFFFFSLSLFISIFGYYLFSLSCVCFFFISQMCCCHC